MLSGDLFAQEPALEADNFFLEGKWQRAASLYSELKEPKEEQILRLGEAYFYLGDYGSAKTAWERANSASAKIYLSMLKAIDSEKELTRLQNAAEGSSDALFWRATGLALLRRGDDERSLYYFWGAVEKDPSDYMSYFFIGTIYENHYLFEDSAKAYKKVIAINPRFAQALNNLGYSYKEMRFWSYAYEYYSKALEIWPDNPSYHYNIGNVYMHKGMPDKAFESYKRAVELDPLFAKAHYNLGKAYLRRGMLNDAVRELKLYIKLWNPSINPLDAPLPGAVKEELREIEEVLRLEKER